jgi:hypothetical protein
MPGVKPPSLTWFCSARRCPIFSRGWPHGLQRPLAPAPPCPYRFLG